MKQSDSDNSGIVEPISPVEFTPPKGDGTGFAFRWRWVYAVIAVFAALGGFAVWFVLTAKSVFIDVVPATAEIEISGGPSFMVGPRYLLRGGEYRLRLRNAGYRDSDTTLVVGEEASQTRQYAMNPLPGRVSVRTAGIDGARVSIGGADVGGTPVVDMEVEAGDYELVVSLDRHRTHRRQIRVEGREVEQRFEVELEPAWAYVGLESEPSGARVYVDGEFAGNTPLVAEILEGERELTLRLPGHKSWGERFEITAGEALRPPPVRLEPADGLVFIESSPAGAGLTVDGEFKGLTPLEISLPPGRGHELTLFREGYQQHRSRLELRPDQQRDVRIELEPVLVSVGVQVAPAGAELYVNGVLVGEASGSVDLLAASQTIEIRKTGYVPHTTEFTPRPGLDQVIRANLQSLEMARLERIAEVDNAAGQRMKLIFPEGRAFTMGSSRREAGRRPNETLREVRLERPFYISTTETSNGQFGRFDPEHTSGTTAGMTLDNASQPVVRVSWQQAALFCNWLSERESLPPFYRVADGEVVGFDPESPGYRLPSEAEWAFVARVDAQGNSLRYPWGDSLPPPPRAGNFADLAARSALTPVMRDYNDGEIVTAPVASFTPNHLGLYDLAGNVAEWTHDHYGSVGLGGSIPTDPLGAETGDAHTIRGSSWTHSAITEMRLSHRDFGTEPRYDVGFRVARYLEPADEEGQGG
ncbi:MAG: PEGA domain-containing protein [Gammaproteobacteria bacterium]|nr:PEGA domain-containing protein [Gammaproteobacteria bacterium]